MQNILYRRSTLKYSTSATRIPRPAFRIPIRKGWERGITRRESVRTWKRPAPLENGEVSFFRSASRYLRLRALSANHVDKRRPWKNHVANRLAMTCRGRIDGGWFLERQRLVSPKCSMAQKRRQLHVAQFFAGNVFLSCAKIVYNKKRMLRKCILFPDKLIAIDF